MDETNALQTQASEFTLTLDQMVNVWLYEKSHLSDSEDTQRTYTELMTSFRLVLHSAGLDVDADYRLIATLAQGWAGTASRKERVVAATYNQRCAVLSSFYDWAITHDYLDKNPLKIVPRRKGEAKDAAHPIAQEDIQKRLQSIDRSTLPGKRDYALLLVALTTGRRSNELAHMRLGDLQITGNKITVTFPRCKGGKVMRDILPPGTSKVLLAYLSAIYGDVAAQPADAGIWLSFAHYCHRQPIGKQSISDICLRWLGTSKVHATRHSFAIRMEEAGARLSDIGARLGHSSLATTSDYMTRLHSDENRFSADIEKMYGIGV
jgi:integrase